MTPEEIRMLVTLIRRVNVLRAERTALMTIIKRSAHINKVPVNWKAEMALIRQSPDFRDIAAEDEAKLSRLEETADHEELMRLLRKLSEGKLPN
jgi:hypothetical protein